MEKGLKVWHLAITAITLLMSMGALVYNLARTQENQRARIEFLEGIARDHGLQIKDMGQQNNLQYKEINQQLTDIKVILQNKEDRNK